jgi:N-acetylglucosamine repressor
VRIPSKATHQQTREHNQRLILRTLYDRGPISRADIARETHLTRTTVSDVMTVLFDRGLVEEIGRGRSSGGKAPILLGLVRDARLVIGLDLGVETFTGALVNLRGELRHVVELPAGGCSGEDALELVYSLCDTLMRAAPGQPVGIGVGAPGIVDSAGGVVRWAANLGWQEVPLGQLLGERYSLPVSLANDSQAAALAAFVFGEGARTANLIAIKVGWGVGAGIILGGELFQGDGFAAGEIGHVAVVEDGAACSCGRYGCLETVASARAIAEHARQLTLADVRAAFEADDPEARDAVLASGRHIGRAVAWLLGVLDVHRVLLHGSVASAFGEPWLESVRDEAGRCSLPVFSDEASIDLAKFPSNVVVLGSSALLLTQELGFSLAR